MISKLIMLWLHLSLLGIIYFLRLLALLSYFVKISIGRKLVHLFLFCSFSNEFRAHSLCDIIHIV